MTIKELDHVTQEDIYIRSLHGDYTDPHPDKTIPLHNFLRAFTGIMNLEVHKLFYTPENTGLIAFVDLPPELVNAMHGTEN